MSVRFIPAERQQGFILVATLWLIAFITVAGAYLAQWAGDARQQIADQQQDMQAEIEFQGTLATVLYLINTHSINEYGVILTELNAEQKEAMSFGMALGPKTLDGKTIKLYDQAYQGLGESIFSVQDESGLMACNNSEPVHLKYFLGLFGLSGTERDDAIARLLDYEDPDSFHRINGAEVEQYKQQGKQAPANRFLLTSWEMRNILGWDKYQEIWNNNLPRLTSSSWEDLPNFNVAPKQILQISMGLTSDSVDKIIQARNQLPITEVDQLYQITGKTFNIDDLSFTSTPSNFFRVTLWNRQTGRMREIHIELHSPITQKDYSLKNRRPWSIDYQLDIALTAEQQNAQPQQLETDLFSNSGSQTKRFQTIPTATSRTAVSQ